ncbi:hypothetical protein LTR48_006587 [Friedmanniomyces endolithicus]|uniref:Uncharacterized protein n=1 Tax=Rachicladosporium monterosium TaxID=1507873 RepID=A0ABR0KZW1_9PEZI|nr:hypothetical protein LTR48_006587 [Friedmanniomyces endolithicus]KAK5141280.1 hypothetical protein LTR32_006121 [Rachicladosporium monterosium]
MASPSPSFLPAFNGTISPDALTHALTALERRTATPSAPEHPALHRNYFLHLCDGNGDVYDAVRDLITDATYWAKEEAHFGVIFSMVQDYNDSASTRALQCPPLAWLRDKWSTRQRSIQRATQATPPSSNCSSHCNGVQKRGRLATQSTGRPATRMSKHDNLPPSAGTRAKTRMKRLNRGRA